MEESFLSPSHGNSIFHFEFKISGKELQPPLALRHSTVPGVGGDLLAGIFALRRHSDHLNVAELRGYYLLVLQFLCSSNFYLRTLFFLTLAILLKFETLGHWRIFEVFKRASLGVARLAP